MEPSTSMISKNSNMTPTTNTNFWLNGSGGNLFRKRKIAATDLEEKTNQKMFVTEEKMVKEMQTLSLELAAQQNNTDILIPNPPIEKEISIDEASTTSIDDDDENSSTDPDEKEARIELHKLLKDGLKTNDFQDSLITKLCEIERKKLTMQLVPYMPIHPAQLNKDTVANKTKEEEDIEEEINDNSESSPVVSDDIKNDNEDYIFKMPDLPTPYTVEEPSDIAIKRGSTMKRSYSQSDQYNSNLSVTELKPDASDYSSIHQSQSAYFIVEPTTTPLCQTTSSSSSLSSSGPSVRITEFNENSSSSNDLINPVDDDDIDMQSVASSDTGDKMDDD